MSERPIFVLKTLQLFHHWVIHVTRHVSECAWHLQIGPVHDPRYNENVSSLEVGWVWTILVSNKIQAIMLAHPKSV